MSVIEMLNKKIVILDGAMGTMIFDKHGNMDPLKANFLYPETVSNIHQQYIESGSNVILTNTFAINKTKLNKLNCTLEDLISQAVMLSKNAVAKSNITDTYVALNIGPIGELLEPHGTLKWQNAYDFFKMQVEIGVKLGVDLIYIETMTDLYEARCALLAAKEASNLPVFVTVSLEKSGKTIMGNLIPAIASVLSRCGADAIGINCSTGPKEMVSFLKEMRMYTDKPIIIKPNAGIPKNVKGNLVYDITPLTFRKEFSQIIKEGANVIGGCCGTTPKHIKELVNEANTCVIKSIDYSGLLVACSGTKVVMFNNIDSIHEQITNDNQNKFQYIDLNNIDDVEEKIKELQIISDLPIVMTGTGGSIKRALPIYNGIAIIKLTENNVDLDEIESLARIYGALLIK